MKATLQGILNFDINSEYFFRYVSLCVIQNPSMGYSSHEMHFV